MTDDIKFEVAKLGYRMVTTIRPSVPMAGGTPDTFEAGEPSRGDSTWLSWDWKSCPELDELRRALAPLGVSVYPDPLLEGSDTYGFIFSRDEHSTDELEVMSREHHGAGS